MTALAVHNVARINKMWFVVLFAGFMLFSVTKTIYRGIQQIAIDSAAAQAQVNALMNNPHSANDIALYSSNMQASQDLDAHDCLLGRAHCARLVFWRGL